MIEVTQILKNHNSSQFIAINQMKHYSAPFI